MNDLSLELGFTEVYQAHSHEDRAIREAHVLRYLMPRIFQPIEALHKEYPRLAGIELMPYHNLGVAKSGHIGENAPLPAVKAATTEMQEAWLTHLRQAGCEVARIS